MLRITETLRWFRLRILVERVALSADQAGALGLAPAFATAMHARSMSRLASADPSPITLDDRQVRGSLGTSGEGPVIPGIAITTLGQFPTDVMDDALDRLGGDRLVASVAHHPRGPLERSRVCRRDRNLLDQQGSQLAGIQAEDFTQREKNRGDTCDSGRPDRGASFRRQWRSSSG